MLALALNPLSKSVAITEIIILLVITALLGFILARMFGRSGLRSLRTEIAEKQVELAECRAMPRSSQQSATSPSVPNKGALRTVYPTPESERAIQQDLTVIEGIGPKIEEILNKNGIINYKSLAATPAVRIATILRGAGPRFQIHDPTTWPQQATLAQEGRWEELTVLKNRLMAGKKPEE